MKQTSAVRVLACLLLAMLVGVGCELASASAAKELVEIHRIVAVGDVHGDAENFVKILRLADLIEEEKGSSSDFLRNPPKWKFSRPLNETVKSRTTLVQMGDLIDRGEQDFESLNIAIGLQEQTRLQQPLSDDKVILLIGNHELLNIQGYYHYVNKQNYGGFMSRPLRREAMDPEGAFGKYIIENFKTAHLEENTLFVHAGIDAEMAISDIDALNLHVREALQKRDFRHLYLRSNGPLWTRKMIGDSMLDDCDEALSVLDTLDAARVIVGHTPQRTGQIEQYCNGRVIAADVGLSRWMYNKVAALEMVFLKYLDTSTQEISTKFVIREVREGSPRSLVSEVWQNQAPKTSAKISSRFSDDEGDL